jgi:hypothetical protein
MGSIPITRSNLTASPGNARRRVPKQDLDCLGNSSGLQARTCARALPEIPAHRPGQSHFCHTWGLTERPSANYVDLAAVGHLRPVIVSSKLPDSCRSA